MSYTRAYSHRTMLTNDDGEPTWKKDSDGNLILNAAGEEVQDSTVTYHTQPNGQGNLVKSVKSGLDDKGNIIYWVTADLNDDEREALAIATGHRFFLDRMAPNAKGDIVMRKGLIRRFKELSANIKNKMNNSSAKYDMSFRKGIMRMLMAEMVELEDIIMDIKPEKEETAQPIGLDDVLRPTPSDASAS
ncbi:MAG: hypothetical protein ACXADY_23060 [Candidatus Hodarchaeales archaeon]